MQDGLLLLVNWAQISHRLEGGSWKLKESKSRRVLVMGRGIGTTIKTVRAVRVMRQEKADVRASNPYYHAYVGMWEF